MKTKAKSYRKPDSFGLSTVILVTFIFLGMRRPARCGTIFVTNSGTVSGTGTIGEYTTTGATVNAALISGLVRPFGITIAAGTPAIPEPSTWAMMLLGFAGVGFAAYRQRSPENGSVLAAA